MKALKNTSFTCCSRRFVLFLFLHIAILKPGYVNLIWGFIFFPSDNSLHNGIGILWFLFSFKRHLASCSQSQVQTFWPESEPHLLLSLLRTKAIACVKELWIWVEWDTTWRNTCSLYMFLWFLKSDTNPQNVKPMECVMMPLYSQVLILESLVPSPDFRYHQVTRWPHC